MKITAAFWLCHRPPHSGAGKRDPQVASSRLALWCQHSSPLLCSFSHSGPTHRNTLPSVLYHPTQLMLSSRYRRAWCGFAAHSTTDPCIISILAQLIDARRGDWEPQVHEKAGTDRRFLLSSQQYCTKLGKKKRGLEKMPWNP